MHISSYHSCPGSHCLVQWAGEESFSVLRCDQINESGESGEVCVRIAGKIFSAKVIEKGRAQTIFDFFYAVLTGTVEISSLALHAVAC